MTAAGTSTPTTEATSKELEGAAELKFDIDWTLMNDEFDAWMQSSDEEEEEGGEGNPKRAGSSKTAPKNMEPLEEELTDGTNSIIK